MQGFCGFCRGAVYWGVDFGEYAAQPDPELDLLQGALLIARDAHPSLDLPAETARVDALAAPLRAARIDALPAGQQVSALQQHLFEQVGLRGNTDDYYDPQNSFLNDVLDRKLGIPITLSVIYVEVARRAGVAANGVGFPGHFLARVESADGGDPLIVDPFHGGSVRTEGDLRALLDNAGGGRAFDRALLEPVPVRQILVRMLMNLRGVYASRGDYPRLLVVLDRIVDLLPDAAREVRDRGLLSARLGAPRAAIDDLRHYVRLAPNAGDIAEVRRIIDQLETRAAPAAN